MKALTCSVVLTSISSRADGSLGLRFATPELSPEEKTAVFELQNNELKMLLQPAGNLSVDSMEVKHQFDTKTPSQRLRNVIFVLYKTANVQGEFEDFYRRQIEMFINQIKEQLPHDNGS